MILQKLTLISTINTYISVHIMLASKQKLIKKITISESKRKKFVAQRAIHLAAVITSSLLALTMVSSLDGQVWSSERQTSPITARLTLCPVPAVFLSFLFFSGSYHAGWHVLARQVLLLTVTALCTPSPCYTASLIGATLFHSFTQSLGPSLPASRCFTQHCHCFDSGPGSDLSDS